MERIMYARITTIKGDASRLRELPDKIKEMIPAAKALPGIIDIYAAWRADGHGTVVAFYDSQASAETAAPQIAAMWSHLGDLMISVPATEAFDHVERLTA
jgi:hypothetical protein